MTTKKQQVDRIFIFTDGSCTKSYMGHLGWGFHASYTNDGNQPGFYEESGYGGNSHYNTSVLAEYTALYNALLYVAKLSKENPQIKVYFRSDSKFMVEQIIYNWNINVEKPYGVMAQKCRNLINTLNLSKNFRWVRRQYNTYADKLSNDWKDTVIRGALTSDLYRIKQEGSKEVGLYIDNKLIDQGENIHKDIILMKKIAECYRVNLKDMVKYKLPIETFPENLLELGI